MKKPTQDASVAHPKRRISKYWIGLMLLVLFNAFLIAFALNKLRVILVDYEAKSPLTALNSYFSNLESGKTDPIHKESNLLLSRWNNWQDYDAYLHSLYDQLPKQPTYRQVASNEPDGRHVYAIYNGDTRLGEIYLYPLPDGGWSAVAPLAFTPSWRITAPGHATVMVNGIPLLPEEAVLRTPLSLFDELPVACKPPMLLCYETEPTLLEPVILITGPEESACSIQTDEEKRSITATLSPIEAQAVNYEAIVTRTAKAYANYASNDLSFSLLSAMLVKDTDLYTRTQKLDRQWYIDHDNFVFENLQVTNIVSSSNDTFIGEIRFDYKVLRGRTVDLFPTRYEMSFVLLNGEWKLLELTV